MKEMINIYNNKRILEKVCPFCQRTDHFIDECPSIKPNFCNKGIILRHKAINSNERQKIIRKKGKSHSAKKFFKLIQEKTKDFEQYGQVYRSSFFG